MLAMIAQQFMQIYGFFSGVTEGRNHPCRRQGRNSTLDRNVLMKRGGLRKGLSIKWPHYLS